MSSNIHVGIAVSCLVLISAFEQEERSITYSPHVVFFSTILGYHFIRVFENCECNLKEALNYLTKEPLSVLIVGILAFSGTCFFGFMIGIKSLLILIPATFITFWYAIPLFKYKGERVSLRNYPTVKIFSIAFVWAIVSVLFPLQNYLLETEVWIVFIQRFLLIMSLVIPFDIRDIRIDAPNLKTLPQQIGIVNAKRMGFLFLILFMGLSFLRYNFEIKHILSDLFVFVLSLGFLYKTKNEQSTYYASFWVESVPIIWFGFLWAYQFIL